ncbi:CopD family protein [Crenobacter cavernae]|uniref:Protoporphyrinogen IX oxidase n=1 Tax=Crenobacter cavernae TaxID=2290923 RepID=A0ABY0FCN4_9NEIS|nr:CopD family protein [Crenobacter cavernae]RXZ43890.1 CopD family protein [Crenobacter cavernae]
MSYALLKTLHIGFVVSWFAGLFYLPRLFVNLAMAETDAERTRLLLMAHKLFRFMTPLAVLAALFGVWLMFSMGIEGGWLHAKLALVAVLIGYHAGCGRLLAAFDAGRNRHGHRWYRVFNEIPVLVMFAVIYLVVAKPF